MCLHMKICLCVCARVCGPRCVSMHIYSPVCVRLWKCVLRGDLTGGLRVCAPCDCVYRVVWGSLPLGPSDPQVCTRGSVCIGIDTRKHRHTVEHTYRHRYTETDTPVTRAHTRPEACLETSCGPALGWPCTGLPSGRKAGCLARGRLAGVDSRGFPSQMGMFSCAQVAAGSQPHPVSSISTHVAMPLTAGQQVCPAGQ